MQRLETWSYVIRDQSAGRKEIRTTESNGHWFHRWGFNDDTLALCFSGSKVTDDNAGESHTEEAFQWLLNEAPLPVLDIFPRLICCHGLFLWCFEVIKWSFIEICSNFYQNPRIWSGDTSWRRQDQGTLADSQNRGYAPCSCRSWMVSGTTFTVCKWLVFWNFSLLLSWLMPCIVQKWYEALGSCYNCILSSIEAWICVSIPQEPRYCNDGSCSACVPILSLE